MSKAQKNQDIREFARRFVRVLDIKDGDVILLKITNDGERLSMFNGLRSALSSTGRTKCLLIAVDTLDDVNVLSPTQMAEFGWVRAAPAEEDGVE